MKKNIFLSLSLIVLFSCTSSPVNYQVKQNSEIKSNYSNEITFQISSGGFTTKATEDRIKSYAAFLTTNYDDPFAPGANPRGNNVITRVNSVPGVTTVSIRNIPRGGPYYGVIAAFDGAVNNPASVNITKEDLTILSADKKWARSSNYVTVGEEIIYTPGDKLTITIALDPFNSPGIDITPETGSTNPGAVFIKEVTP